MASSPRMRSTASVAPELPQRQLVYELKHAIDQVMRRPWDTRAADRLAKLIEDNPRGAASRHVQYNLGVARGAALADWMRRPLVRPKISDDGGDILRG